MPTGQNSDTLKTAHHEAGHFVAAFSCGAQVHEISCVSQQFDGVGEVCGFGRITDYPSVQVNVIALLAGPLSEARYVATISHIRDLLFDEDHLPSLDNGIADREKLLVPYDPQTGKELGEAFALLKDSDAPENEFRDLMRQTKLLLNRAESITATGALANDLARDRELPDGYASELLARFIKR